MKNIRFLIVTILTFLLNSSAASQLQVTFSGDTTKIWDKAISWYCGARFTMQVERSNDSISVTELDTMQMTTCTCYFTLCASVVGLPAGSYSAYVNRRLKVSGHGFTIDTTFYIGTIAFTVTNGSTSNLTVKSYQSSCSQFPGQVDQHGEQPNSFYLLTNYPNPFNPRTVIQYAIPKSSRTTIAVYDVHGNLVKTLVDRYSVAGRFEISFDASAFSSGMYLVRLTSDQVSLVNKIVLVK